ncbi:MAG TPA: hypothetical protein VFJ57_00070 [Solirubrobacterales bacterium]|nr:hypothetical protein [Solirubrobacterales bacterium]
MSDFGNGGGPVATGTVTSGGGGTPRENVLGYDVVKAAPSYSGAAGLVSGFALAAVVLVLTVAASSDLDHRQQIYLGFATSLFALGFIGCLFCAFSFASLSGVLISLVAILGGFEALAQALLHELAVVFVAVTGLTAAIAPLFVWFPHWDIVQRFGESVHEGTLRSPDEAEALVLRIWLVGAIAAGAGVALHYSALLGEPKQWEYLVLTFTGLTYVGGVVALALFVSTRSGRARATKMETWILAGFQSATVLIILALMP